MSEPSRPAPSTPEAAPKPPRDRVELVLYALAFVTYVPLAIYQKFLLDWIAGPVWLVAWVWGVPAIGRLLRHEPVRPQRGRVGGIE